MGINSALSSGVSSIPVAGPILGGAINAVTPVDISGAQQAEADSRELEKMFLAQMGQYQPTPGLSYGGSAPVSYAPSGVPGQPAPAMTPSAPAGGLPSPTGLPGAPLSSPAAS